MKRAAFIQVIQFFFASFFSICIFTPAVAFADTTAPDPSLPLGTVTQSQPATLPSDLQALATGKFVTYVTSDVNNNRLYASGLIITPNTRPANANTVSWSHAFSGLADQCAPSQNLTYFYPEAVNAIKSYLQQGWTVAATDFEGLGTPGNYEAFIGNTEARSVIDSVRAARNLDATLTNKWVAAGHSGGGSSPLFVGEIGNSYGPELNLKGVVSMAPLSNVDVILPQLVGTQGQGYIPVALTGLSYVDPRINVASFLAQPAQNKLSVLSTGCVFDILQAYAFLPANQLLVDGQLPSTVVSELAHYDNPGQHISSAPILLLQGTADQEIPASLTELLQSEICAQGSTSYLQELSGVGHDDLPTVTTQLVANYISDRFNNTQPAPNNCQ